MSIEAAFTRCESNAHWIHTDYVHTAKFQTELLLGYHTHCSTKQQFLPSFCWANLLGSSCIKTHASPSSHLSYLVAGKVELPNSGHSLALSSLDNYYASGPAYGIYIVCRSCIHSFIHSVISMNNISAHSSKCSSCKSLYRHKSIARSV